ncbi:WD40 repeat-like protein, partial [Coemansia reversa NRRL 1564]
FIRSAKWSPDGTLVATNTDNNTLRLYDLTDVVSQYATQTQGAKTSLSTIMQISHGETLLDYAWYPYMNQHAPATCCLIESTSDHPLHLRDSNSGGVRASYAAYNAKELLMTASSTAFSGDGSSVFGGYTNYIARFDVQRPGTPVDLASTSPSRRSRGGLKGIVSCLVPAPGSMPTGMLGCASFSGQIGLVHSTTDMKEMTVWRMPEEYRCCGITELKWAPDGMHLWAASRQSSHIVAWDIRDLRGPFATMPRACPTQQRMSFDFDAAGTQLVAGETDGSITFHDIQDQRPPVRIAAHGDLVAGVSAHPFYPLLATASGQRHF